MAVGGGALRGRRRRQPRCSPRAALAGIGYLLVVVAGAVADGQHRASRATTPFALSLWGTFVPAGIALAGLATAGFADPRAGARSSPSTSSLLAVALIIAIVAVPHGRAARGTTSERAVARTRCAPPPPLSVAFFCFALLFLALAGLLPAYLVERRGLAAADAGRIVAIATAFGIAGQPFGGLADAARRVARPAGRGRPARLDRASPPSAFSRALPVPLAVAGFALSFALGGLVPAAAFASVPLVAGDARAIGPINGLLAQAGSLGSLAGPPLLACGSTGRAGRWRRCCCSPSRRSARPQRLPSGGARPASRPP